ncbi:uncharacterized protein LOC124795815 [Schistocerca piceifrons]|uniref:uncharacterized protein LOC124795815 n=1 Tax=Schistocerca piceifrons TaxID=274613 RepID=UPI001F5E71BA|nr:uncharacterized protein LOC124795815 [Schistocerca piceifrons]
MPTGRGGRLIIAHAGSLTTGFTSEAKLVFCGGKSSCQSNYHSEVNGEVFKNWFIRLLSALEEGSVITMDNTSHHSIQIEKLPGSNWLVADIIIIIIIVEWLKRKNVSFSVSETKAEFLSKEEIVGAKKIYELDQLATEMKPQVVWLPLYHCHYNPIELIWVQVKR